MKKSLLILLTICLSACDPPPKPDFEGQRCSPYIVLDEDRKLIEMASFCQCHNYEINYENIGRISDPVNYPLEHCHAIVGFKPTSSVWFANYFKEMKQWAIDNGFLNASSNLNRDITDR